jgi:hypothetical protein
MFAATGVSGHLPAARRAINESLTAEAPGLLNPILLIKAASESDLNILGFGLPS